MNNPQVWCTRVFSLLFSEFLRLLYTKGSHLSARQSPCIYHQKGSSITSIYACLLHIGLLFCALQFGIWIFFVGSLATRCSPPCSLSSPLTSPPPPLQTLKPPSIRRSCWRTLYSRGPFPFPSLPSFCSLLFWSLHQSSVAQLFASWFNRKWIESSISSIRGIWMADSSQSNTQVSPLSFLLLSPHSIQRW